VINRATIFTKAIGLPRGTLSLLAFNTKLSTCFYMHVHHCHFQPFSSKRIDSKHDKTTKLLAKLKEILLLISSRLSAM
jgi:hypothetical protein